MVADSKQRVNNNLNFAQSYNHVKPGINIEEEIVSLDVLSQCINYETLKYKSTSPFGIGFVSISVRLCVSEVHTNLTLVAGL